MKKILQDILQENNWTILEAVINEIMEENDPVDTLLYYKEHWIEWWIISCLEFEKDWVKFFNKHYKEIEEIRLHIENDNKIIIPNVYSMKFYYSILAFNFIAFELYINLVLEDL